MLSLIGACALGAQPQTFTGVVSAFVSLGLLNRIQIGKR